LALLLLLLSKLFPQVQHLGHEVAGLVLYIMPAI
jgi:hypothetical protein